MPALRRLAKPARSIGSAPRISVAAQKLRFGQVGALDPIRLVNGLNDPESRIYWALKELKIQFDVQTNLFGGSILGGARADFLLPAYGIDLEYQGPFHGTTSGSGRDLLRNLAIIKAGYRVVALYEQDLRQLKRRINELIGRPT